MDEENTILKKNLNLFSAYAKFLKYYYTQASPNKEKNSANHPFYSNFEPFYTTWGTDFIGTVDYIW